MSKAQTPALKNEPKMISSLCQDHGNWPGVCSWYATSSRSSPTASEFDRTAPCGSRVWVSSRGAEGSVTSSSLKLAGACSCARYR